MGDASAGWVPRGARRSRRPRVRDCRGNAGPGCGYLSRPGRGRREGARAFCGHARSARGKAQGARGIGGYHVRRGLLLAYFFPPLGGGGCQRTLKLVRYLLPLGWSSVVVTTRDRDYRILDPSLLTEVPA